GTVGGGPKGATLPCTVAAIEKGFSTVERALGPQGGPPSHGTPKVAARENLPIDPRTFPRLPQSALYGGYPGTAHPGKRGIGCRGPILEGQFPALEKGGPKGLVQIQIQR